MKTRAATIEDFKVGSVLFTSEGYKRVLRNEYDKGVFETRENVLVFSSEARFYTIAI